MTTNLTGQTISATYDQLLHVDGGPTATAKIVYSGTGTATALKVATTHIEIDNIKLDTNTISTLDTNGNLTLAPNGTGSVAISKVAITGGQISGITDLALADGGTGASDASGARTNLGLGSMATQASNNVTITGGAISGVTFSGTFSGITAITSDSFFTSNVAAGLTLSNNDLLADGTDTNINIDLIPKGTGSVTTTKLEATTSIGYGTGAGGTVTQLTSRTTGVTLNKICGQITLFAAGITGHEADEFVLTNSTIGADDTVLVCVKSGAAGATRKYYHTQVVAVSAGSCIISVGNIDNNAIASESPVLSFAVIKGVVA